MKTEKKIYFSVDLIGDRGEAKERVKERGAEIHRIVLSIRGWQGTIGNRKFPS